MSLEIGFRGAAGNVTGSRTLLKAGDTRVLVDCGLFQERSFQDRNWKPFLTDPATLDAVVLTHAHVDHCGLLPRLVKQGFKGPVYCTQATAEIAEIVLMDAARLQQEDTAYKQKRHRRQGRKSPHPYEPLYDESDVAAALSQFQPLPYETEHALSDTVRLTLRNAGHILGSGMASFSVQTPAGERTMLFSCDVGRRNSPILQDPAVPDRADYLAVESTYGDRTHENNSDIPARLAEVIACASEQQGRIIVPCFAVERAQELLFHIGRLKERKAIPDLPVYLDSPMAVRVTEVFRRHPELFDDNSRQLIADGRHPCDFPGLRLCRTVDESKAVNTQTGTHMIIAGSGMCTGGRIKHHLANGIARPESIVLFVGYQAQGTLGRLILDGEKEVRIHGEHFPVKACIERIHGFSAHADREELLEWMGDISPPPRHVFVVHGEIHAAEAFAELIRARKGWPASVPDYGDNVLLAENAPAS